MEPGEAIDIIGRYQRSNRRNPAEDRLTSALGALLAESGELANRAARHFLGGRRRPTRTLVRTQRPIGGTKGWVDLELDVRSPFQAMIWIEAKLDAPEGPSQLANYRRAMAAFDREGPQRLFLLAPSSQLRKFTAVERWSKGKRGQDRTPYLVAWEDLYLAIEAPPSDHQVAWLHKQVLGYMYKQGLAPPASRACKDQVSRVREFTKLSPTVAIVRERLTAAGWTQSSSSGQYDSPKEGYWESEYEPLQPAGRRTKSSAALFWNISVPHVSAGVRFATDGGGPVAPTGDARWASQILAARATADGAEWDLEYDKDPKFVWVTCSQELSDGNNGSANDAARPIADFIDWAFTSATSLRASVTPR